MTLYITKNGQQLGPYTLEETQRFVAAGNFVATDFAWYEGLATWIPLSQVPGFATSASHGAPVFPEQTPRPERPVMVWIICILYFIGTVFGIIGLAILPFLSHLPNLPEAQKDYLESLGVLYYCGQAFGVVANLIAAILLFMLRRLALYFFAGMFVFEILQMIIQIMNPNWLATVHALSVVFIVIIWAINIAILWYVWHLARTKVLR